MRRRDFVVLAGGIAATWPFAADAQPEMAVIGFLHSASPQRFVATVEALRQGLRETGYSEGHNVKIEYRWADDQNDRLPVLAADLIHRGVAVIVANRVAARVAKDATTTIPIVFESGIDPVSIHLVTSLAQPGGNATGVSFLTLEAKKLEFLDELTPRGTIIAALVNPNNVGVAAHSDQLLIAAQALGRQLTILQASRNDDFNATFDGIAQHGAKSLLVTGDPLFDDRRKELIALAERYSIATIYSDRDSVDDGGLMSYGSDRQQAYRLVGIYAGRILKGAHPADLPVLQPMRIQLVINLRTARALGLDIPQTLLDRADELIG